MHEWKNLWQGGNVTNGLRQTLKKKNTCMHARTYIRYTVDIKDSLTMPKKNKISNTMDGCVRYNSQCSLVLFSKVQIFCVISNMSSAFTDSIFNGVAFLLFYHQVLLLRHNSEADSTHAGPLIKVQECGWGLS